MKKEILIIVFLLYSLVLQQDKPLFTKFYYQIKEIQKPDQFDTLVNKNHRLSPTYIPKDLEELSTKVAYDQKFLRHDAKEAFEKLSVDALALGYHIVCVSAYRSYDYQKDLYQHYVDTKGLEYADQCSARPGHSEHQTGLSLDVMGSNMDYNLFLHSVEYDWMHKNAHKYGFILRYPKGKEHITGFKFEPWHYRYVGTKLSTYLYENQLTLEEYKK